MLLSPAGTSTVLGGRPWTTSALMRVPCSGPSSNLDVARRHDGCWRDGRRRRRLRGDRFVHGAMRLQRRDPPTLVEGVAREEEETRPRRVKRPAGPRGSRSWPRAPLLGAVALRWLSAPRLKSCPQGQPLLRVLPSRPTTNSGPCRWPRVDRSLLEPAMTGPPLAVGVLDRFERGVPLQVEVPDHAVPVDAPFPPLAVVANGLVFLLAMTCRGRIACSRRRTTARQRHASKPETSRDPGNPRSGSGFVRAGDPGIEPGVAVLETAVLPIHQSPSAPAV